MKEHFPIFRHHKGLIYLDNAATTHKPQSVIDTLAQFYSSEYATVHRSVYGLSLMATEKYYSARETVARFLHAKHTSEIVFTRGTTDSLNLVAASYARAFLKKGDEILTSTIEHHSNLIPWQMAALATGAVLKYIPIDEQGSLLWEGTITEKTKIISLAHVSNVTGTIHPIASIARAAHEKDAIVVVDGAQGAPHMEVDVQRLDCDFYAFSGHKCYGPTGIGVLYGKKTLLEKMAPIQGGGDMIANAGLEKSTYADPPFRFEAGTPIIGGAIGLKSALDFIENTGLRRIADHEDALLKRAMKQLASIATLRILGTAPQKGPIITFHIEGVHPLDLATFLDLKGIAIRSGHFCAQPAIREFGLETAARASFGIYNTPDEIDLFCEAVREAADKLRH
ncbi:MAG TPA: cysteine desulfurase [Chlamydiales bacterium]|nr:cysteine desulfurase [Chlamydiales bacterium]